MKESQKRMDKCSPHNICSSPNLQKNSCVSAPHAQVWNAGPVPPSPGPQPSLRPPSLGRTSHSLLRTSKHVTDTRALQIALRPADHLRAVTGRQELSP